VLLIRVGDLADSAGSPTVSAKLRMKGKTDRLGVAAVLVLQ